MPLNDVKINNLETLLTRGVSEAIDRDNLEKRIKKGEKLRVKLGIDPTAPDLHLGHAVVLRKLKQFQDAGHKAIFIVGDFTATIGDPSGRSELRPKITEKEVKQNMTNYIKDAGKIIDMKKADVRYNSEWYKNKGASFLMELTSNFTIARSLERDDFQKRLKENRDISILEVLYPIMQGYDSVEVRADVELGGTDQKFNLLMGRKVQRRYGMKEQDIITTPLLEGTDGVRKMSKSLGNYIGLSEDPYEIFAKTMSIRDDLMVKYFTLLTDIDNKEIDELKQDMLMHDTVKRSAKEWKEALSYEIVRLYYGEKEAQKAKNKFAKVYTNHETPADMPEVEINEEKINIVDLLTKTGLASSKSEARRLIQQRGVQTSKDSVNWEKVTDIKEEMDIPDGMMVRVGKRRFLKLTTKPK